jgi:hypothetical protein
LDNLGYIQAQKRGVSFSLRDKEWDIMAFTFTNPTPIASTIEPFNPQLANTVNFPTTPIALAPYVIGDSDYNLVVRDGFNSPYWIRRAYFFSQDTANFNQTFYHIYKDANGNEYNVPQTPSLSVGTMQFQSGIGQLDYEDKQTVFGINQWYTNVRLSPFSDLTMIFMYQQLDKSQLLSGISTELFDDSVNRFNTIQKFSLEDIKRNDIMPLNAQAITPVDIVGLNAVLGSRGMAENVPQIGNADRCSF